MDLPNSRESDVWIMGIAGLQKVVVVFFLNGAFFRSEHITFLGTNISLARAFLKMIFLFPRWDMLIPWRVGS